MELIGKILWFDERDGNGIIVDPHGNEFYFDNSVLKLRKGEKVSSRQVVIFNFNPEIEYCLCACNVSLPTKSKAIKARRTFDAEKIINI